ncbi:hypothetical protein MBLNU457_g3056t1 [Dothideomycetes sp. NU457]
MTDSGRKDMSSKMSETMTPDSQKSTMDQAKEGITDTADKASRSMQPDSEKSTTQQMSDKAGASKDSSSNQGGSMMDSVKNTLGMGGNSS